MSKPIKNRRCAGKISNWKDTRGFGFISPIGGGKEVFLHIKSFVYQHRRPANEEMVSYEIEFDTNGRPQAKRVLFAGEKIPVTTSPGQSANSIILLFAVAFLLFVFGVVVMGKIPIIVLGFYIFFSFVSYIAYAMDKSAAQKGLWRTSEKALHFFALIGGWPGALFAQQQYRHKTKKKSFQSIFWMVVVTNCCFFIWLITKSGVLFLKSFH